VAKLKHLLVAVPLLVAFHAFSACSLTVDLDYLQDRKCPSGQKLCNDTCVSKTDPRTGCAADSCIPCTLAHSNSTCAGNGVCAVAGCLDSYQDCNRLADDGCEIDIDHDPNHCGSCTAAPCVVPNAAPDCAAGRCAIRLCNEGFGDCNGTASDGCETDLRTSSTHCSKCNMACSSGTTCISGKCQ
jgi:hypothetical protein